MSSRARLDHSLNAFSGELLSFVQRASDSINSLKRTVEQRPAAGVQDFKECLDDLEQQVSDFTDEVQQLVECTSDTTSFEELIGHCAAVYSSNRATALALEEHLSQYGYQKPPGALLEPKNPYDGMVEDDAGLFAVRDGVISRTCSSTGLGRLSVKTAGCGPLVPIGGQQRHAHSTPTSPVSKNMLGTVKAAHMPSRLGMSQPGSPMTSYRAPAAGTADVYGTVGPKAGSMGIGMQQGWGLGSEAGYMQNSGCAPLTSMKQPDRVSLGSNASSTPAGLLISPGVAALANKYATSSVGGSSVGALSLPDQPSTGPLATRGKHTACRDLSLSYGAGDTNSPDLPIFGRTPALSSQQEQQQEQGQQGAGVDGHQQQQGRGFASGHGPADQLMPDVAAGAAAACTEAGAAAGGAGGDDDTTGELYSSLIHSNMNGLMHAGDDAMRGGRDCGDEPATPPAAASTSCPSSPQAPTTAGRLPAEWHSKKMQELEDLQANVTLTLSQMKRTPSRSRLAALADEQTDNDDDTDGEDDQQRAGLEPGRSQQRGWRGQQVQQQLVFGSGGSSNSDEANTGSGSGMQQQGQQEDGQHVFADTLASVAPEQGSAGSSAAVAAAAADAAFARLQALPDTSIAGKQQQNAHSQAMAGATSSAANRNAAAAAAAAVSAAAAAAAAATADLESMMATLSMKYAAAEPADAAAADATPAGLGNASSPAASEPSPLADAAEPECLSLKYASLTIEATAAAAGTLAALEGQRDKVALAADVPPLPPPMPSASPRRQQPARSAAAAAGTAALVRSSSSTGAVGCSVASDASCISSCDTATPGKPRLAAALATWHSAVRMDCPSPLSPDSPSPLSPSSPAAAPAAADGGADTAAVVAHDGETDDVQRASLLTPATQQAIRDAVAAAGLDTAARPKSSIRRLQPTTDLQRLEEMRGMYRNGSQQQQQQQVGLAENLESRLASVAEAAAAPSSSAAGVAGIAAEQTVGEKQQPGAEEEQEGASPSAAAAAASSQQHSLRSRRQSTHAGSKQAKLPNLVVPSLDLKQVQQQEQLTPRAARLQRRLQMQEQQQQQAGSARKAAAASAGSVLRAVENVPAPPPAAAAAARGSAEKKQRPAAVPVVHAQPVSEEEFDKLPGWCKGLLSVELLNGALQELAELAAGRAGKRGSASCEGFTAGDLELLGHSSSKSKTIVSCLHKLNRATLQRSAAGSNVYKLVGTAS